MSLGREIALSDAGRLALLVVAISAIWLCVGLGIGWTLFAC